MSEIRLTNGGGIGPLTLLSATTSTGTGVRYDLKQPMSKWAFQVVAGSATASVLLEGCVASSSDATFTTIGTFNRSSDASGATLFITDMPASSIRATLNAGASSNGCSAWVSASP